MESETESVPVSVLVRVMESETESVPVPVPVRCYLTMSHDFKIYFILQNLIIPPPPLLSPFVSKCFE